MTWDVLSLNAIEILARGHELYGAQHVEAGLADAPEQLRQHAQRLAALNGEGMGPAAPANLRMAAGLRHTAVADSELAAVLADGRTDHAAGRQETRRVLDDARGDVTPAADTPLGRQEALRRMAVRLRRQRHFVYRSHRKSHLLAHRLRRLARDRFR